MIASPWSALLLGLIPAVFLIEAAHTGIRWLWSIGTDRSSEE